MSRKTFTLTSTHYCCHCGCFDVVTEQPSWFKKYLLFGKSKMVCYGCGTKTSPKKMANNSPRGLPHSIDSYFFQTHLRNQKLLQKQIKPLTEFLGIALVAATVLVLIDLPIAAPILNQPHIEWAELADSVSEFHEADVVQALKSELDQVLEKNNIIPVLLEATK